MSPVDDTAEAGARAEITRPSSTTRVQVVRVEAGARDPRGDSLATEEPMEIRVDQPGAEQRSVAVTMRTPGDDFALAAGFLFTEGLITGQADVQSIRYCSVPREEQHYNVVSVAVTRKLELGTQRNFYATSSCGICGKASLDMIDVQCAPLGDGPLVQAATILGLPYELRRVQSLFDKTGGLHAVALFDPAGRLSARSKTSAGTTPSTSWSAPSCSPGTSRCPRACFSSPAGRASRSSRRPPPPGSRSCARSPLPRASRSTQLAASG